MRAIHNGRMRKFDTHPLLSMSALALAGALLASGCAVAPVPAPAPVRVKLVAFNDFHGNIQSPGRFAASARGSERVAVGGADALAAWVARLTAENANHVVVGGGDFVGASPLASALFFDEPAVEALNHVGVDFTSVGNHEFDKGEAELLRLQRGGCKITDGKPDPNSCRGLGSRAPGTFDGARFQWLSANVVDTASGRTMLPAYGIKTFDGVPVAFIGMTLRGTPGIVSPSGVAGLEFRDEAATVNALVPQLRAQGVQAIVVLVHQGGVQAESAASDINGCAGALANPNGSESDIGRIVRRLDDAVALVVSAHTHAAYNCSANAADGGAKGLPNSTGRLVPVTSASAFGRVVTDIDLTLDPRTHAVLGVSPVNRLVTRDDPVTAQAIAAHPEVRDIVNGYAALVAPLAGAEIGRITTPMPTAPDESGEMLAGSAIADAQLAATQSAALGGAQIAFMNEGGVRQPGFVPAAGASLPFTLTYGGLFTVQPFGNSLVTMTVTTAQLKTLLEDQLAGCHGKNFDTYLQPSNGFRYTWRAKGAACERIAEVTFTPTDVTRAPPVATGPVQVLVKDGVVREPTRTFRLTVSNFLATGGDGAGVLAQGTDRVGGAQDLDAFVHFMAAYKAPAKPYDPRGAAQGEPRIVRVP